MGQLCPSSSHCCYNSNKLGLFKSSLRFQVEMLQTYARKSDASIVTMHKAMLNAVPHVNWGRPQERGVQPVRCTGAHDVLGGPQKSNFN